MPRSSSAAKLIKFFNDDEVAVQLTIRLNKTSKEKMAKSKLKYTSTNLKKLENLFKEIGYKIIYEKGHFNSGYCIVNERKTIVINKFYKTDTRITCLLSILNEIEVITEGLEQETLTFYQDLIFE